MRSMTVSIATIGILLASGSGQLRTNGAGQTAATVYEAATHAGSWRGRTAAPDSAPNCGKGARPRKVVAKYKAKRHEKGGYRKDTLYCGNSKYGFRHLEPHIAQYFGGWGNFNFSITQVLKKPATWVVQENGNFLESGPIYQCFFQGYYIIWTFFIVPQIQSGTIVTAYGREGRRVNQSCPVRRSAGSDAAVALPYTRLDTQ